MKASVLPLLALLLVIGTVHATVLSAAPTTKYVGANKYQIIYRITADVPTTCTVNEVWWGNGSVPYNKVVGGNPFSILTAAGSFVTEIQLKKGPGQYSLVTTCYPSCGADGYCSSTVGGDEIAGTTGSTNPAVCLQDCGCTGGLTYNPTTGTCQSACNSIASPDPSLWTQGCVVAAGGPTGSFSVDTTKACPKTVGGQNQVCQVCLGGAYMAAGSSTSKCTYYLPQIADAKCRADLGEPSLWSGGVPNPDCDQVCKWDADMDGQKDSGGVGLGCTPGQLNSCTITGPPKVSYTDQCDSRGCWITIGAWQACP